MSVLITLTTVTLMLTVPTLLGASPVPVTMDTQGMESTVLVSYYYVGTVPIGLRLVLSEMLLQGYIIHKSSIFQATLFMMLTTLSLQSFLTFFLIHLLLSPYTFLLHWQSKETDYLNFNY